MALVHRVVVPLRALLALTFTGLLAAQAVGLPFLVRAQAEASPELADLRGPLLVLPVLALACVQVVIVCTWRLLSMVAQDRIFSAAALVWVDVIVAAIAAAWLLVLVTFVLLVSTWRLSGIPSLLLLLLLAGAALGLLMVVLRALLQQATTLRTDMDAVI